MQFPTKLVGGAGGPNLSIINDDDHIRAHTGRVRRRRAGLVRRAPRQRLPLDQGTPCRIAWLEPAA